MCYTVQSGTRPPSKYAERRGHIEYAEKIKEKIETLKATRLPMYHVSGFAHPRLLVFTNNRPLEPQAFTWGFIAPWTKTITDAKKFWNNTLNARSETMFELNSFKDSALHKRCLVYLDAFYEYHHYKGKTFPFRIAPESKEPLIVAGLWSEWSDRESGEIFNTVSIVTTKANALMTKIHNNPKATEGPRMPVILAPEKQDEWLMEIRTEEDKKKLLELAVPFSEDQLEAYTVARLSGKEAIGNVPEVEQVMKYPEMEW